MNTLTVIQARTGSKRLPGKVLQHIGQTTLLEAVYARLSLTKQNRGETIVATSCRPWDDPVAAQAQRLGVGCYRSSEHDVLNRIYQAAIAYHADAVIRVTADCPLLCPDLLDNVTELIQTGRHDYVGVTGCPEGLGQEAITTQALTEAWHNARLAEDREHVITWTEANRNCVYLKAPDWMRPYAHWHLSVDTPQDLDMIRALYALSGGELFNMPSRDILELVQRHTALRQLAEQAAA